MMGLRESGSGIVEFVSLFFFFFFGRVVNYIGNPRVVLVYLSGLNDSVRM